MFVMERAQSVPLWGHKDTRYLPDKQIVPLKLPVASLQVINNYRCHARLFLSVNLGVLLSWTVCQLNTKGSLVYFPAQQYFTT